MGKCRRALHTPLPHAFICVPSVPAGLTDRTYVFLMLRAPLKIPYNIILIDFTCLVVAASSCVFTSNDQLFPVAIIPPWILQFYKYF